MYSRNYFVTFYRLQYFCRDYHATYYATKEAKCMPVIIVTGYGKTLRIGSRAQLFFIAYGDNIANITFLQLWLDKP